MDQARMLREIRKRTGWTQDEAAGLAHVKTRTYQRWEAGENEPSELVIEKLLARAGLPPDWTPENEKPRPDDEVEVDVAPVAPENVRAFRAYFGMTPAQAGEIVRRPASTWNNWESGRARMNPTFLDLACDRLREPFGAWYPVPTTRPPLSVDEAVARISAALQLVRRVP